MRIPKKLKYPNFRLTHWRMASKLTSDLRTYLDNEEFRQAKHLLLGLKALAKVRTLIKLSCGSVFHCCFKVLKEWKDAESTKIDAVDGSKVIRDMSKEVKAADKRLKSRKKEKKVSRMSVSAEATTDEGGDEDSQVI